MLIQVSLTMAAARVGLRDVTVVLVERKKEQRQDFEASEHHQEQQQQQQRDETLSEGGQGRNEHKHLDRSPLYRQDRTDPPS